MFKLNIYIMKLISKKTFDNIVNDKMDKVAIYIRRFV